MNHQTTQSSQETNAGDQPVGLTDHQQVFAAVVGQALAQAWSRAGQGNAQPPNTESDDECPHSPTD